MPFSQPGCNLASVAALAGIEDLQMLATCAPASIRQQLSPQISFDPVEGVVDDLQMVIQFAIAVERVVKTSVQFTPAHRLLAGIER